MNIEQLPDGMQFRLARVARGMTLFDVGSRAGVPPPRLSEFERGRRQLPPEAIDRLRAALTGNPMERPVKIRQWSPEHDQCVQCGTTESRHGGGGYCAGCYSRNRYRARRVGMDWTPSDGPIGEAEPYRGETHHSAKLTEEDVRMIRYLRQAEGATEAALAEHFGVSNVTIHKILHRELWRHVA